MKPILVKQSRPKDCGMACLAMVLGMRSSQDVDKFLGERVHDEEFDGLTDAELMHVLNIMDVPYRYYAAREAMPCLDSNLMTSRQLASRMNADTKCLYIAGVPSLNHEGGFHLVVCYKGEIYDPSNAKIYNGTADILEPVCIIQILKEPK